ncbi:hypothetical protein [Leptobacterium sp. I13]|uniref:hypothetical protein n=1 Tax=Leptobacterium meishanense TaxID=3128904 RepID=UPI0030EDCAD0
MSNNIENKNTSEEIDLGQLFKLIGNAFSRFFNFIGTIFMGLFHLFITFLVFIQKHFIKFAIAGVIGLAIGFYLDRERGTLYESSMVVEPNFNSYQQLYNNISFYNELAKAEDSTGLGNALKIETNEAKSIKEIRIEPYAVHNQKIELYDRFLKRLDTIVSNKIDIEAYIENFESFDARFHKITIISTNPNIAKHTQPSIVKSVTSNNYFKRQKKTNDENLNIKDSLSKKQLRQIDSLQELYKKVMIKSAEQPNAGTNINLAEQQETDNKEIELLKQADRIKEEIVSLNQERANKLDVVNIISDFPERGNKQGGITNNNKFTFSVGTVLLLMLFLLVMELNKFLNRYKERKST